MFTLSIDTSAAEAGSWALLDGGRVLVEEKFSGRASAGLFSSLEEKLDREKRIERILVGVGPGSFSGIRVGIAAAQGFGLVWNCEIVPVRSSGAIAQQFLEVSYLGVFAPARREEYFATFYERGKLARPTQLVAAAALEGFLSKCSLAVSAEPTSGIETRAFPSASQLARHFLEQGSEKNLPLEPIYLASPVS